MTNYYDRSNAKMTPYHLEVLLFLPMNNDLWTAADLQAILDHEDAEMQRKLRTVKMMPPYKINPTAISHPMWKMLCYNVICVYGIVSFWASEKLQYC